MRYVLPVALISIGCASATPAWRTGAPTRVDAPSATPAVIASALTTDPTPPDEVPVGEGEHPHRHQADERSVEGPTHAH